MNTIEVGKNFLAHYGVKGMHWGIRNEPVPLATNYRGIINAVKKTPRKKKLLQRLNDATAYASQNPDNFVAVRQSRNITVMTGKEFIDAVLANNGYISVSNISPIDIQTSSVQK